jgi:hypothetical protein
LFIPILLIPSDYEITQKIECFGTVERFTVENLFLLVVDAAKTAIENSFKGVGDLAQVCRLSVPLKYFLCQEKGDYDFRFGINKG